MVDRAIVVLSVAVAAQMLFGLSSWAPALPTGVRRDDLEAELRLAETALELAAKAEASGGSSGGLGDPLLEAAVRNLQLRLKLVAKMLDGYDTRPWFQRAWIDATSMRGHTEWLRQWRVEWAAAAKEVAAAAADPMVRAADDSDGDGTCPAGSGSCAEPSSVASSRRQQRQRSRPPPRQQPKPSLAEPRIPEDAVPADIEPTLDEILRLMEAQPTSTLAQERGCEALRYIATDDETRQLISDKRGVQIVLAGMRANEGHADVLGYCAGTLTHLAATPSIRAQILSLEGVETLLHAMGDHVDSVLVQYKGCAALANIGATASDQAKVAAVGGIEAVVSAMDHHADQKIVQEHCLGALYNLASTPGNRRRISEAGAEKQVRRALAKHPGVLDVQKLGKDLLGVFAK